MLVISAIAAIVVGVGMMRWAFAGAVVVIALVGIAATVRGVSLIMNGISERSREVDERRKRVMRRDAA